MPSCQERIAVISWLFCCRTAWSQGVSARGRCSRRHRLPALPGPWRSLTLFTAAWPSFTSAFAPAACLSFAQALTQMTLSVEVGECIVNAFGLHTRSSCVLHNSLPVAGFLYLRMSRRSGGSCARETSCMQGKQFSESASSSCAWPLARGPSWIVGEKLRA